MDGKNPTVEAEVMDNLPVEREKTLYVIPKDRVESIIELADQSERLMVALKKIRQEVLSLTNEKDWTDQNGTPYLEGSGCQKVARWYGVSWKFLGDPERVDIGDGHYRYDIKMAFWKKDDYIEVIGSRASNDPFFTTYYEYDEKEHKKVKRQRHAREVDSGNVLKAAITNGMQGILAFLGMKKLTWEDLKSAGLSTSKIHDEKSVKYGKKDETEKPNPSQPKPDSPKPDALKNQDAGRPSINGSKGTTVRTDFPKDGKRPTQKQISALTSILKKAKIPLPMVTEKLYNFQAFVPEVLTIDEISAVIGHYVKGENGGNSK